MRRDLPQDARVDRRAFLARMAALAAAAPAGLAISPTELRGAPPPPSAAAVVSGRGSALAPGSVDAFRRARRELRRWLRRPVPSELEELTAAEAAALVASGRLDPGELLEARLARIRALDGVYRAWNDLREAAAMDEVRRLDPTAGALAGVTLAVKDNYHVAGALTTANSWIFREFRPAVDATAVARLRAAGAVVIGKTQMGPLATTRATTPDGRATTVNAWIPGDRSFNPGGSSTGTATAVAARMACSGIGTQTGGSITSPALAQGLTGLKPTMGRVSLKGVIPLSYTRDHPGPIARDALDAALLLQAMAGPDPQDPRTLGLPPVPDYLRAAAPVERGGRTVLRWPTTVGILPGYFGGPAVEDDEPQGPGTPLRRRALEEGAARRVMVRVLESLGARVVEVPYPEEWARLTSGALNNVRLPERSEPFLEWLRADVRLFGNALSPWINGLLLSGDEFLRGQRAKERLLRLVLDEIFSACDVVVQTTPIPFDMIGLPLIAFPIGFDETEGPARPMGALLGAPPFGEERLLSVAAAYQAVTDWHRRRPPEPDPELVATAPPGPRPWWADEAPREEGGRPDEDPGPRIDLLEVMELCQ